MASIKPYQLEALNSPVLDSPSLLVDLLRFPRVIFLPFPMNRRFLLVVSTFSFAILFLFSGHSFGFNLLRLRNGIGNTLSTPHRKLLRRAMEEPDRTWGEKCDKADIVINQGPTAPLPSGIPTYTVEILNMCVTGCDISGIHLTCGWFSSAHLINPKIFKRLRYNDCLVNNGQPLINGGTISFQYANTFPYPLSVSRVVCS